MTISPDKVACIVLAAGSSQRFGVSDKLLAPLGGKPLLSYCVDLATSFDFAQRVMVVKNAMLDHHYVSSFHSKFKITADDARTDQQSGSLRLGFAHVDTDKVEAILVLLADMPLVTSGHLKSIFDVFESDIAVPVASSNGQTVKPPVLFPVSMTDRIMEMRGDVGAKSLLTDAIKIETSEEELMDIDTIEDLKHAGKLLEMKQRSRTDIR